MENATHALLMAFSVLVFIIALTVSMVAFNNAKQAADILLYTKDEQNYYEYMGATGKAAENRIVGLETIIPTLYKYYKENYTVVFKQGMYDYDTGDITNWQYLPVYKTSANRNWQTSYNTLMNRKYGIENPSDEIFAFDLDEETLRHEPWTGSYHKIKNNLDCFLNGSTYINPNNNTNYIDYSKLPLQTGGFISKYKNAKFVETIAEYNYNSIQSNDSEDGSTVSSLTKEKSKRMIIFTYIKNN